MQNFIIIYIGFGMIYVTQTMWWSFCGISSKYNIDFFFKCFNLKLSEYLSFSTGYF